MERRTTIYGWLTRRILRRDEDLTVNECSDGVRSADALQVRGVYCAYTPLPRTLDRSEMLYLH